MKIKRGFFIYWIINLITWIRMAIKAPINNTYNVLYLNKDNFKEIYNGKWVVYINPTKVEKFSNLMAILNVDNKENAKLAALLDVRERNEVLFIEDGIIKRPDCQMEIGENMDIFKPFDYYFYFTVDKYFTKIRERYNEVDKSKLIFSLLKEMVEVYVADLIF